MTNEFMQLMIDLAGVVGAEPFLALIACESLVARLDEDGYINHLFSIGARIGYEKLAACMTNSFAIHLVFLDEQLTQRENNGVEIRNLSVAEIVRILHE